MTKSCAAYGCTARRVVGGLRTFHSFPRNAVLCEKWIIATKRKNFKPSSGSYICSDHFVEEAFDRSKTSGFCSRRFLKQDAVPSVFAFPDHLAPKKVKSRKPPKNRNFQQLTHDADNANVSDQIDVERRGILRSSTTEMQTPTIRYVGDCADKETDSLLDVKKKLRFVLHAYQLQRKRVKGLLQRCRRIKRRYISLNNILEELQDKKLISEQASTNLENIGAELKDLIQRQMKGKNKVKYPPSLRTFALTLHFYSAKAYEYVRKTFNTCLPHQNTLRRWYSSVNGQPGFTDEALKMLTSKCQQQENHEIICALMMDEMSIRKHIEWDGKRSYGYVNYGTGFDDDSVGVAKEAFVLMVVAINGHWKLPVGYFLTDGLDSKEKANIITESLIKIHSTGIRVVSLTFDGASSNLAMLKILGADLSNVHNLKTWFPHPINDQPVFVFLDACHMLKLIRNCFGERKTFLDCNNGTVNYNFIEKLFELQKKEGLHAGNKLRKHHLEWQRQKMKVKLAAQLLSRSVADAIEFCSDQLNLLSFQGCQATVTFIKVIDQCFDILNSRNFLGKDFKQPISIRNLEKVSQFVDLASLYLLNLKDNNGKCMHETNRKTGFIGLVTCLQSVVQLSRKLLESSNSNFKFLLTYKLSQDHLEMFFSSVRSQGGFNNNPTARQFMSTYKRLLVHHALRNMTSGNCLAQDTTGILSISSSPVIINQLEWRLKYDDFTTTTSETAKGTEHSEDLFHMSPTQLSEYSEEVVKYIGGFVARKVRRLIHCSACSNAVTDDNSACLLVDKKSRGYLLKPSADVISICKITEKFIRQAVSGGFKFLKDFMMKIPAMKLSIRKHLAGKQLFVALKSHIEDLPVEDNHMILLINLIINSYIDVRVHHISSAETIRLQGTRVRNTLTKLILFKNQ